MPYWSLFKQASLAKINTTIETRIEGRKITAGFKARNGVGRNMQRRDNKRVTKNKNTGGISKRPDTSIMRIGIVTGRNKKISLRKENKSKTSKKLKDIRFNVMPGLSTIPISWS